MTTTLSGTTISGNVTMDPALPLVAIAGSTTTVSALRGIALSFSVFSSVTGGYLPYKYVIISGTLPAGLSLNSSVGVVSGTPTTLQASSSVIFAVQDGFGNQAATTVTVSFSVAAPTYTIQYLVVAGGGAGGAASGGGYPGGGGGAGGLVTSSKCLTQGSSLTVIVGAGAAVATVGTQAQNGGPSSITAPTPLAPVFPTVTACGGGRGATSIAPAGRGNNGGSGGGGAACTPAAFATCGGSGLATGSPGIGVAGTQGYPGGPGIGSSGGGSGGGGGAGGAGGAGTPLATTSPGGAGGLATLWPYSGNYYAGGGGGGSSSQATVFGLGGGTATTAQKGGGGDGGRSSGAPPSPTTPGGSGTPGTGGGGGGGQYNAPTFGGTGTGGGGGGGVVIFAVPIAASTSPSLSYAGGSLSCAAPTYSASYKLITYSTPGTYTITF